MGCLSRNQRSMLSSMVLETRLPIPLVRLPYNVWCNHSYQNTKTTDKCVKTGAKHILCWMPQSKASLIWVKTWWQHRSNAGIITSRQAACTAVSMTSHDDCLSDSTVYNTLMNVYIYIPLQSHTVKGATSHTDNERHCQTFLPTQ